jgi:hypothetical protein
MRFWSWLRLGRFAWYNAGMSTANYLDRLLELITEALTSEIARKIVELRAEPELQAHVDQLADKANQGTLTPDEVHEYKSYIEAADIIGIIQAKARRCLAERPAE